MEVKSIYVLVVLQAVLPSLKADYYVTARGCVRCYDKPMKHVKVYLKDDDTVGAETMASGYADGNGCFELTGKGGDALFNPKPEPFIRVEYRYRGTYGAMEVEGLVFGENHGGKTQVKPYARNIDFGTFMFQSFNCKTYTEFYDAVENFYQRASIRLPMDTLHIRTGVIAHGGTAYTTTDVIRLPNSYKLANLRTDLCRHELFHAVRHTLDGGDLHFDYDAVRFWYARHHDCDTESNHGYAFNEGFAAYWAGQCPGVYGSGASKYNYEGNVAGALRKLRSTCSSSDYKFVQVLKAYPGSIHTFAEFNNHHYTKYGCKL